MNSINGARAISVLAMALLAGCASNQPAKECEQLEPEVVVKTKIVDHSCTWFKPFYPKPADILADESARVVVGNNDAGAEHCGWKPPAK